MAVRIDMMWWVFEFRGLNLTMCEHGHDHENRAAPASCIYVSASMRTYTCAKNSHANTLINHNSSRGRWSQKANRFGGGGWWQKCEERRPAKPASFWSACVCVIGKWCLPSFGSLKYIFWTSFIDPLAAQIFNHAYIYGRCRVSHALYLLLSIFGHYIGLLNEPRKVGWWVDNTFV